MLRVVREGFVVLLALVATGCGVQPSSAVPTAKQSMPAPTASAVGDPVVVDAGRFQATVACSPEGDLVWPSSSSQNAAQFKFDEILASTPDHRRPWVVAASQHGGSIFSGRTANGWVVVEELQQVGSEAHWSFWYLSLVNLRTKQATQLAESTMQPMASEPPDLTMSGDLVVWDELTSGGDKILRTFTVSSGARSTLSWPGVRPTSPVVDGQRIAFLDNATDPHASGQVNATRGGRLMLYDISAQRLTKLDSAPDARQEAMTGALIAWQGQGPGGNFNVWISGLDGSPAKLISDLGFRLQLSTTSLMWTGPAGTFEYRLDTQAISRLSVPALQDVRSWTPAFALCGNLVYYSPIYQGATSHPIYAHRAM